MRIEIPLYALGALLLTVVTEVALARLLGVKKKDELLMLVLINCVTNPALNACMFAASVLFGLSGGRYLLCALLPELAVVLAEGRFFRREISVCRVGPYTLALLLNAATYLLGSAIVLLTAAS